MIGNDVVDLALARKESNWQRKGFLAKLFTLQEQRDILTSDNPVITIWTKWSRKEAAYKIYNRQTGIRAFIPLLFESVENTATSGNVICKGTTYYTITAITSDSIHTIAVADPAEFLKVRFLNNRKGLEKVNGIPYIGQCPVSISTHGRFEEIVTLQSYRPSLDFNFKNNKAIV